MTRVGFYSRDSILVVIYLLNHNLMIITRNFSFSLVRVSSLVTRNQFLSSHPDSSLQQVAIGMFKKDHEIDPDSIFFPFISRVHLLSSRGRKRERKNLEDVTI